jgi:hypothetical protein
MTARSFASYGGVWFFVVFALALTTPIAAGPAGAAEGGAYGLRYELWQGGLNALAVEARLIRDKGRYRAGFKAKTQGFVGWLYPYKLEAAARGKVEPAGYRPESYEARTKRGKRQRRRVIAYDGNGAFEVRSDPKSGRDGRYPAANEGAPLDPVSAAAALIEGFAAEGRCGGNFPVFDGKRRYRFVARDGGRARLERSRYGLYAGPVSRCRVTLVPEAGFDGKKGAKTRASLPSEITVDLAPAGDGWPPVPVRMEGRSSLGAMVLHLVAVEGGAARRTARR